MFIKNKYKKVVIVEGMHCSHCAIRVEDALKRVNGVSSIKIDLDKKSNDNF